MLWKWKGGFVKMPGEKQSPAAEKKQRGRPLTAKAIVVLCAASFLLGLLLSSRVRFPSTAEKSKSSSVIESNVPVVEPDCVHKRRLEEANPVADVMGEVTRTHRAIQSLEKSISYLEMELAEKRRGAAIDGSTRRPKKVFAVIGINTAFSSKRRRDSLRQTWVPTGSKLEKLEKEKGLVVRFVIGHSATPGDAVERAIDAEDAVTKDFLRLNHTEGYHQLTAKTKTYFATAVGIWDADFYVKVDDDVHVNLGMLMATLVRHRTKPRVYIGCMKSGPVLFQKEVKYYEPEFSKFGGEGNQYFRHATGQIYAISKDLANFVSINGPILHKYANEDVSLGSWLIGLEVEHVDDRTMCCGTPPDCEWRKKAGKVCVASFDWSCSGVCKSVERMKDVHTSCGEGEEATWGLVAHHAI